MKSFRKYLPSIVAVFVGAVALVTPSQARANFSLQVLDDGNPFAMTVLVNTNGTIAFMGTTTHFIVNISSATSNFPGTPGGSQMTLINNDSITANFIPGPTTSHTITIVVSEIGWTAPSGNPLTLSSSAGGSMTQTNGTTQQTITSTYQGFLDNTNAAFGQPVAGSTPLQNSTASLTGTGTAPFNYTPGTALNPVTPGGTPFSMTEVLTFTFNLQPGYGALTASASDTTTASPSAAPAPAGIILALTGAPVMGIGAWFRRRRLAV